MLKENENKGVAMLFCSIAIACSPTLLAWFARIFIFRHVVLRFPLTWQNIHFIIAFQFPILFVSSGGGGGRIENMWQGIMGVAALF